MIMVHRRGDRIYRTRLALRRQMELAKRHAAAADKWRAESSALKSKLREKQLRWGVAGLVAGLFIAFWVVGRI